MMKRRIALLLACVLMVCAALPAYSAGWEQQQSGEWVYYLDNGQMVQNRMIEDRGGKLYYVGPDGCMVSSNYTPHGYWLGADGAVEKQWGQRTDSAEPLVGRAYGENYGYSYTFYRDVYGDGVVHWSMTESYAPAGYSKTYEIYPINGGTDIAYEVMDLLAGMTVGYLTVSPDSRVLYITMGGYTQRLVVQ